ncbi:hypothetical protein PLESTB_000760900 [Pleodorina starrii]|uniref:S1 motif domain-containing protein n=1 Tax=Pleodorina starrii TaxID=330485 RepID=A0A9W6BKI8_9CHLO|nr:hypothetical protein PLESTM_001576800 [Pleodorina starrii]GLC53543.1 hypothetical protein PLESTB_000760900 [Pleodorina starrii]GLC65758.1 hypothetical protein PLESTF_000336900 [Pleodorina starrii]
MSDNDDVEDQVAGQHAEDDGEEAAAEGEGGEAAGLVEGEADEEDEAEYQDSSEEDDDEEQNEYEADGFIVDDAEEEEEEEEKREAPKRRKKKKRERELRLDDDDYDLLEENQVQGFRRPKRIRLKSTAEDVRKANDAADIQKELFGYEDLEDEVEDAGGRDDRRDTYEQAGDDFDDLDEQDEMADFIVEGDDGAPRRHRRRRAAEIPGVSSRAMQDAFDIFGDVDALMDMYAAARQKPAGPGAGGEGDLDGEAAGEDEEDEYMEDDDEAAAEARRQRRQQRQRDKTYKQAMKVMDPEQLARAHLRPEDQEIKDRDVPERLQEVLGLDGGAGAAAAGPGAGMDLDAAAEWVYATMREANTPEWQLLARGVEEIDGTYDSATASGRLDDPRAGEHRGEVEGEDVLGGPRDALLRLSYHRAVLMPRSESGMKGWSDDETRHGRVRQAIRQVLTQFFDRHEEVPVVAMYRKELAGPLLAMAADDVPVVTTEDELQRQRDMRAKKHYDQGFVQPHHRRIRRWAVLWAVFDLALKFRSLTQRRDRASAALARSRDLLHSTMADIDPASERMAQLDFDLRSLDECVDALQAANTSEALADVQQRMSHVLTSYPEVQMAALSITTGTGAGAGSTRRPNRGAANKAARMLGIQELVSDFSLTSAQFLANLADAGQGGLANEPPTPPGTLADWANGALEALRAKHPENVALTAYTADNLVSQVRAAAVSNLINDAGVRTFLRNEFYRHAVVSSDATEAGRAVLDPFHKYALAARLRKKPIHSFGGSDLMLRLEEANRERLAQLRLHLESGQQDKLVADVAELFQSSDRGAIAQQWNTLRQEIVKSALEQHLLPAFRTHFQAKLLADARECSLRQYADALWHVATAGPLRLPLADAEDEFLTNPRLCIVVYGNQEVNPATGQPNNTAVVFLNELGNLVDFFFAGQLSGNLRRSGQGAGAVFTDPAKSKDAARIREKLLEHLPHAVLVGMSAPQCRQLHEDIRNIADSLLEHSADALQDHETRGIYCYPVDEKLAKLWENSSAARSELREHAPLVRRAVGLGRGALDPLSLLAALCGPDKEVLSLNVYDMQDALSKDERMAAVTRVMVTATAQIGVDVNLACNVTWRSELLQFVPGLGPRKAGALLAALTRNRNKAESRSMLYKDLGCLGKVVFRNAGPYLRVLKVPGVRHLENLSFRTLDNTRISPEMYRLAIQLAQAAAGGGDAEEALEKRDKIECYDLEAFMNDIGLTGPSPGLASLIDIVAELVCPNLELRPPWPELNTLQVYMLCNNESEESLREGRIVDVKITYVTRDALKVVLINSGTEGMVRAEDVSGSTGNYTGRVGGPEWQAAMQSRLNTVARARILRVEEQPDASGEGKRFMVMLSTKSSVVNDEDGEYENKYCTNREQYYVPRERGESTTRRRADEHRPREQQVLVRPIRHPMFKNVSQVDANASLGKEEVAVGSCIIRPNVRGNPNVLDVSIKTAHGPSSSTPVIMVAQLQESEKPQGRAAHLTLAPPFSIDLNYCGLGTVQYEDLDEVLGNFVEPLVQNCMAVTSHRKYVDAAQAVVEDRVRQEKQANPKVHPYYLTIHKGNMFYIVFCVANSVHKEPFYASPKGFYFRSRTYSDIEHVLTTFKKQPVDPAKRAGAHRSEAAGYPGGGGGGGGGRDVPHGMRTGMQPQGGSQYGGGAQYGQYNSYYGGGGGSQYPPTQAYGGGGGGMYGGGGQQYPGGGGHGAFPPPPPPYGSQGGGGSYNQYGGGGAGSGYRGW